MSVHTEYDNIRDELREKLENCLKLSMQLLDENIWGYKDMRDNYSYDVILAIKKAKDAV